MASETDGHIFPMICDSRSLITELLYGFRYWLLPCTNYQRSNIMNKSQLSSSFPHQTQWSAALWGRCTHDNRKLAFNIPLWTRKL